MCAHSLVLTQISILDPFIGCFLPPMVNTLRHTSCFALRSLVTLSRLFLIRSTFLGSYHGSFFYTCTKSLALACIDSTYFVHISSTFAGHFFRIGTYGYLLVFFFLFFSVLSFLLCNYPFIFLASLFLSFFSSLLCHIAEIVACCFHLLILARSRLSAMIALPFSFSVWCQNRGGKM